MNEMKCKRCGANENRIHGFCSMECETAWYYEDDIRDLTARIAELEGLAQQLVWVGNDLLTDNTNPITITLFSGLVANMKEIEVQE